jgi:hypothetical protein
VLFFLFGIVAGLMKSNLAIPESVSKFLSLYLLMAIGLKGGLALAQSGLTQDVVIVMLIAVGMATGVPIVAYRLLRPSLNGYDAAAVAATYGSISAVTFVTANEYLTSAGVPYEGYMSAAMALMESPGIIVAVYIANKLRQNASSSIGLLVKDSFIEGANLLLIASLIIGIIEGPAGYSTMKPFTGDLFTGLLAFFLLDMGIQVAKNIPELKGKSPALLLYAILAPLAHSAVALLLCILMGVSLGNTVLLMVLCASASYIAVPAALKHSVPEASSSIYLGLSLGVTFPFNVILGIPLYHAVAIWAMG